MKNLNSLSTTEISESDENFLKKFSRDFYQKIIDTEDFDIFENTLIEWIQNIDKDTKLVLRLMKNHHQTELLFSSIIGFFYQHGIGCDIDRDNALKLYEKSLTNENFNNLNLLEGNEEFDILQSINIIIGKYLMSLFCYKDIILEISFGDRMIESAIKGDSKAQYDLGTFNYDKEGITKEKRAFEWYLKSANNGYAKGQYGLGNCYYSGKGVMLDISKAFEWYSKSANNGCADGQYSLGDCYYYGRGITKDYKKAFEWYLKSANNGCAKGQSNLGSCYYYGEGVKRDHKKAFEWYSKFS